MANSVHYYGTDSARSWTLWASTVLQTAATSRCVYISTNATRQRTLKTAPRPTALISHFILISKAKLKQLYVQRLFKKKSYPLKRLNQENYAIHQIQQRCWR